ncbi:MAG: Asp-tRNA(Asn)/Glu-tRNA(Gln) amidotransferase subunit GatC [Elusimicrobiota bacterium]|jgi:aspartyl-tRNA(Asn)/glutamyl-tRNA(Gln) amidotransferase subunit C|nr:Asp-tRNA(Asn)/Glu-tRNA(Gln) amidotransferase subunit GatC [Elusimicrobiota bacterium]
MKIALDEIKKTAKLSKFEITEDEAKLYAAQLSQILEWMGQLQNVDTSISEADAAFTTPLRRDEAELSPSAKDIVCAFNDKSGNLLKVRKVL